MVDFSKHFLYIGFQEYYWQILKPSITGRIVTDDISLLLGFENRFLNADLIMLVMGVVVIALNVWFNCVFEFIEKRKG